MGPSISSYAFQAQEAADKAHPVDQTLTLRQIHATVLIIVRRYDWICPVIVSERVHTEISESQLIVFEQSGHCPWIEEPEKFHAEVMQFLNQ